MSKPYDNSIYIENGFESREDYLIHLTDEYGLPIEIVKALADLYGDYEAFDGLVSALDDAGEQY